MDRDFSQGGHMAIVFDSYLRRLKAIEMSKPPEIRRNVPNAAEIARISGLEQTTTNRIVRGRVKSIPISKVVKILNVMNNLGFETRITDFVTYEFEPAG